MLIELFQFLNLSSDTLAIWLAILTMYNRHKYGYTYREGYSISKLYERICLSGRLLSCCSSCGLVGGGIADIMEHHESSKVSNWSEVNNADRSLPYSL